jgi:hypothetical protein
MNLSRLENQWIRLGLVIFCHSGKPLAHWSKSPSNNPSLTKLPVTRPGASIRALVCRAGSRPTRTGSQAATCCRNIALEARPITVAPPVQPRPSDPGPMTRDIGDSHFLAGRPSLLRPAIHSTPTPSWTVCQNLSTAWLLACCAQRLEQAVYGPYGASRGWWDRGLRSLSRLLLREGERE